MTRYSLNILFLTLTLCSAVAVFNYIVDPYAVYHFKNADSERLSRVEQFYRMRLSKPWQLSQIDPTAVVIGTSRTGSISPSHPSWPEQQSFNLSVPDMTPYELLRFVEHAQANGPLDKLTIGLDFEAFVSAEPHTRPGFVEARMAPQQGVSESLRAGWQRVLDISDTLLSIDALSLSIAAVSGADEPERHYYSDGSWVKAKARLTGRSGMAFVGKERIIAFRDKTFDLKKNIAQLGQILRFCHQHNIDTRLFVTPEHVFLIDLWSRLGYQELWVEFHRSLIAINRDIARDMGQAAFPLWGFNDLEKFVDEPIAKSGKGLQSHFVDGVHFQKGFGGAIMDGVWDESTGIGARLDRERLDLYMVKVQQLSDKFAARNQRLIAQMHEDMNLPVQ
jgi:hypothetical protein